MKARNIIDIYKKNLPRNITNNYSEPTPENETNYISDISHQCTIVIQKS